MPSIYKSSLISTLLFRSYTICSNWTLIHAEITKIKSFMTKNGYPPLLIDKIVSLFLNKLYSSDHKRSNTNKQKGFQVFLPYLGNFSKRVEKKIKKAAQQHLPNIKINFIYRAPTRLRNLFTFKDKIPSYLTAGIVYKFTCGRCKSTYIGETIRHSKRRFCEHMGISALTGNVLKGQNLTAVKQHIDHCKCKTSVDNFEIIGRDTNSEFNLRVKESLFVHRDSPDLNVQGSSIPLVLFKN